MGNVTHEYGSPNLNDYVIKDVEGLTNGDEEFENNVAVTMTGDSALKDDNKHTNNVGDNYSWQGSVSGIEGLNNNYIINYTGGKSEVTPAELTIDLGNVTHEYGSPNLNDYIIGSVTGLTNGDENLKDRLDVTMTNDTALKDNNAHTNNAGGDYTWTGTVDGIEDLETNYNIKVNEGKSEVSKADLNIVVDDKTIILGDKPSYTGNFNEEQLKNGDKLEDFGKVDYVITDEELETKPNVSGHKNVIGIIIGDSFYIGDEDFVGKDIFKNYNVHIESGDLKVIPLSPEEESSKWGNLLNDAPWDRNRDFRERKAEFNYTDGGVAIEKNDEDIVVEA